MQQNQEYIQPLDFKGIDNQEDTTNFLFCWRWITTDNGKAYRVVTMEDTNQSFQNSQNKNLTPVNLKWTQEYDQDLLSNSLFQYRLIKADNGMIFRVVTIESVAMSIQQNGDISKIVPENLIGIYGYNENNDMDQYLFHQRSIKAQDEASYRCLTIEIDASKVFLGIITPLDLLGSKNEFEQEIYQFLFCWRMIQIQINDYGQNFMVVTLEDDGQIQQKTIEKSITPLNLQYAEGFAELSQNHAFYWREFQRGDKIFRVLTLEEGSKAAVKNAEIENKITPNQFKGVNGYESGLKDSFGFRRLTVNNGQSYLVLTIE